jgi:hypothetical protein
MEALMTAKPSNKRMKIREAEILSNVPRLKTTEDEEYSCNEQTE